jgi:hypothetical protein
MYYIKKMISYLNKNPGVEEYRFFNKLVIESKFLHEMMLEGRKKNCEHRTDFYILPLNETFTKQESSKYGLKFRDVKFDGQEYTSNMLELKIKLSSKENGIELWDKVISQNLDKPITLLTKSNEGIMIEKELYKLNLDAVLELCIKTLKENNINNDFIEALKGLNIIFCLAVKSRYQTVYEDTYINSYTFDLKSQKALNTEFKSICAEGEAVSFIELLKVKQHSSTKICGYPEAIINNFLTNIKN